MKLNHVLNRRALLCVRLSAVFYNISESLWLVLREKWRNYLILGNVWVLE